jgi:hypothetical protein
MFQNKIKEDLLAGKNKIDFKDDNRPLGDRMLTFPHRAYVIFKMKAPLREVIESSKKFYQLTNALIKYTSMLRMRFGRLEEVKLFQPNARLFREYKERFFEYENNPSRLALFKAAFDIFISEIEHDNYYSDRLQVLIEWLIQDIFDGKWKPRENMKPNSDYWNEEPPYGGENTIIYKMIKHGKKIKKILEDSNE